MNEETGHEEIGASVEAATGADTQALMAQVEELAQKDPQLGVEISQQELAAEQQIQADPQQAQEIENQFERTAVEEIALLDPQLAQQLAAEIPPSPSPTPTPQPQSNQPAEPSPVVSEALIQEQEQALFLQDPQLQAELQQQYSEAEQQGIQTPTQDAQITEQFMTEMAQEIGRVDPQLGQELSNQQHGVDLTMNAQGEPEQGPAPSNQTIGDPNQDASQWSFQGANGYCGPNSVTMMLEATTGLHLNEQQVVDWAVQNGEMTRMPAADDPSTLPSIHYGMTAEEAAAAINHWGEQYGVTAEAQYGNMSDLEGYLKQGREVMIFIDAQRIWHESGQSDPGSPDHYVVVTGFDPSTDTVYINDPGLPYGKEEAIPLSEFESAWSTSQDTMIVTETSKGGGAGGDAESTPGPVLLPITLDSSLVRQV
jgi:hypothetical protein